MAWLCRYINPLAASLSYWEQLSVTAVIKSETNPYKFKPVHIVVDLGELVDVPIDHPLRYHYKLVATHCRSQ